MNLQRLLNIPKRLRQDAEIITICKNWREFLQAKWSGGEYNKIILRNGVSLECPQEISLGFLFSEIWVDRVYNPPNYEIKEGDTIIDIGANIGVFAIYAATAAPNVTVYSYEPFPQNFAYLKKNVVESNLKNVKINEKAVASKVGERTLKISHAWILHALTDDNEESGISVKCTTLNEILEDMPNCNMLKFDCEGGEYEILYSCSPENLAKIDKIVGEYHQKDAEKMNGDSLCLFLKENNFRIDYFHSFNNHCGLICATKN